MPKNQRLQKIIYTLLEALDMERPNDMEISNSEDSSDIYDSEEEECFFSNVDSVNEEEASDKEETLAVSHPTQPQVGWLLPSSSSEDEFIPPSQTSYSTSRPVTRFSDGASISLPTQRSPIHGPSTHRKRTRQRGCGAASKRSKPAVSRSDDVRERWHNAEEPDVEPQSPKFQPKNPVGPRIDCTTTWSPLSLFKLFFSSSSLYNIKNNTNANAEKRIAAGMKFDWFPLSVQELHVFLSIIIFSGMIRLHARSDMWRRDWPYNFGFPRSHMTRDRFESIFWSLHLCSITEDEENKKRKGTSAYDKLVKIKPLYNEIIHACNSLYQPGREITIHKRMVASKDRTGFRQFTKDTATRFGYKLVVLADSQTGYTWNFFIYQGKTENVQGEGLSYTSVMDLMNFRQLGEGYHLYVDNFYSSSALFQKLSAHNTLACGIVRPTCIGFPTTKVNDLPKNAERGDMRWLRKDNLLFVKWKDTKEVTMCSSFHKAFTGHTTKRRVKKAGQKQIKNIDVPDPVRDYNKYMGGLGFSDALIQYYSVHGKTMKWYKTFFYHFLDIAIFNSFILLKQLAISRGDTPMTQKRFREILMKELVDEAKAIDAASAPQPTLSTTCLPMYFGEKAGEARRVCVQCKAQGRKVKTPVYCSKCNVALCFTSGRNCFRDFHLKQ
ncbi:piggyBac transposable element-derived protein 4 [Melanotaenia boesemani]|uniref:piggyBac transposable element-derived protein 4 n=1 Tax=Melanotaenia boesemani TaxID=1250792 RepID=UPI001C04F1B3|nr:piggyBac transposable element-derived protein 4 [Melanotaenia boesemani]